MIDLLVWLWICEMKEAKVQVSHYVHSTMYRNTYNWHYSSYLLASNKRLEERPTNNKLTRAKVHLIFLVRKPYQPDGKFIKISAAFEAPNTSIYQEPHKYNELEYRIANTKKIMVFFLRITEIFCQPSYAIVSIFCKGKVICAGMVCANLI